jgi:hypothetical protein
VRRQAKVLCDVCGELVSVRGLASHKQSRVCPGMAAVRRCQARGWVALDVDLRSHGLECEVVSPPATGSWGGRYSRPLVFWYPAWVGQSADILRAASPGIAFPDAPMHLRPDPNGPSYWQFQNEFWALARRDVEWRDALIACSLVDLPGAIEMIRRRLVEKEEIT